MIRTRVLGTVGMVLAAVALLPAASVPAANSATAAASAQSAFDQQAFWQTTKVYCDTCHFGPKARASLNLQGLDFAHLDTQGATWEKVLRKLRTREMPPAGMPRPDEATYQKLVAAIENERGRLAEVQPNPGRATQPHGI
jgi:hypothetical protein